jgi:hypothetical protein
MSWLQDRSGIPLLQVFKHYKTAASPSAQLLTYPTSFSLTAKTRFNPQ